MHRNMHCSPCFNVMFTLNVRVTEQLNKFAKVYSERGRKYVRNGCALDC